MLNIHLEVLEGLVQTLAALEFIGHQEVGVQVVMPSYYLVELVHAVVFGLVEYTLGLFGPLKSGRIYLCMLMG